MPVIHLKSPEEIEKMRVSGRILARTLRLVSEEIVPGKTPKQLDAIAHRLIEEAGGRPNFLNYRGTYPAATCISVNSTVVHGIPNDDNDMNIVRSIIALGRSLNLNVIAEGVETEQQRAFLRAEGCDEMQGYLFSRPKPSAELDALLPPNRDKHT